MRADFCGSGVRLYTLSLSVKVYMGCGGVRVCVYVGDMTLTDYM